VDWADIRLVRRKKAPRARAARRESRGSLDIWVLLLSEVRRMLTAFASGGKWSATADAKRDQRSLVPSLGRALTRRSFHWYICRVVSPHSAGKDGANCSRVRSAMKKFRGFLRPVFRGSR